MTALAMMMSGIAVFFQIRRDRLPDATRLENVRELRAQEERLLAERRAELSIVEQKIQDRDRLIAQVSALEERHKAVQAELASLDAARREIEEVKEQAAAAAADLAIATQELAKKSAELEALDAQLNPERLAEAKREVEKLSSERAALETSLPSLRAERDSALRSIEAARALQAQHAALALELSRTREELEGLAAKKGELLEVEASLRSRRDETVRLADELDRSAARRNALLSEISDLEDRVRQLQDQDEERAKLKVELDEQRLLRNQLAEQVEYLAARKERLAAETGEGGGADASALLEDLTRLPTSLEAPATLRHASRPEQEALYAVTKYLQDHRLDYSARTVDAFHTALKINDNTQLTVLAGVSGTGKSLLPRRYAEAMGIHFLQIAVEPRWDSPQDLLGFYNYIEKKYRATDLARLLVHMDPYSSSELHDPRQPRGDHMALVLLDEMNLARVEYYFSEFLSRLEVRPTYAEASDERKRKDAMIPIDIRGLKKSVSLFPAHNVLFAGTMNDDESTQALSDKVLDRGNVLQFAAPREFKKPTGIQNVERPDQAQSFKSWRGWVRSVESLGAANRETADAAIGTLAEIMEDCGRPFGHRLRDAILAYVANYPVRGNGGLDVRVPLADQIEFRILPKLRGIDIQSHGNAFDKLKSLIGDDLSDQEFAERIGDLLGKQENGSGLFVWRGLTRRG
ncbi:chromosome segregation ATPase-like protein [Microvirga arabica]